MPAVVLPGRQAGPGRGVICGPVQVSHLKGSGDQGKPARRCWGTETSPEDLCRPLVGTPVNSSGRGDPKHFKGGTAAQWIADDHERAARDGHLQRQRAQPFIEPSFEKMNLQGRNPARKLRSTQVLLPTYQAGINSRMVCNTAVPERTVGCSRGGGNVVRCRWMLHSVTGFVHL